MAKPVDGEILQVLCQGIVGRKGRNEMKNIAEMMKAAIKWETGYLTYGEIYEQLSLIDPEYMERYAKTVRLDLIIHAIKLAWVLQEMAAAKVAQTAEDIKLVVPDQRLQDLLTSAFEGGSNYWYQIDAFNYPEGQTKESLKIEFPHVELPFKGGSLTISSGGDMPVKTLDRAAIEKGLDVMAQKYPRDYADFLAENDDANTGDAFLQCCLYGELIFG